MVTSSEPLRAESVLNELQRNGVTDVVYLPDTETGYMYSGLVQSDFRVIPVCREGESMAIAAGLIMGGRQPVVLIQNTGFFESGDSIRGICLDLKLPLVILVGYRGYVGEGRTSPDSAAIYIEPILNAWGIPYHIITSDANVHHISEAYRQAQETGHTVVVLIGKEYE